MVNKRKSPILQFKGKVALATIENGVTTAQISSRFGVHPTMVSTWKRQVLEVAPDIFDKSPKANKGFETRTNELYRQIDQFKVEYDFLSPKFGS